MRYSRISADCHVDLPRLPPDLFTTNASAALKNRMPHVTDGPKGPVWVTRQGASLGLMNGMGSAGREYIPGQMHRSDRMAATGLYEDGKRGVRRLSDPELRLKDQERDGVQAEVLYGILGTTRRLNDAEAAVEVMRIYNEWLADFCDTHPDRYAGLAFEDLGLTMRPSDYWRRQCRTTYQTDRIGIKLLDEIGADTIMWGSDFPHPDGVWPDSSEFIERELGHLPAAIRQKIVCENAGRLYGFVR